MYSWVHFSSGTIRLACESKGKHKLHSVDVITRYVFLFKLDVYLWLVYTIICDLCTHPIVYVTLVHMIMCGFRTTKLRRGCYNRIRLSLYICLSWVSKVFVNKPVLQIHQ